MIAHMLLSSTLSLKALMVLLIIVRPLADRLQGVLDAVGHYRLPTMEQIDAVPVATFNQFKLLWCQCCDLVLRERASSKLLLT